MGGESRLAALAGHDLLPVPGVGLVFKRRSEESRGTPRHGQPQVVLYAACIPESVNPCQEFFFEPRVLHAKTRMLDKPGAVTQTTHSFRGKDE